MVVFLARCFKRLLVLTPGVILALIVTDSLLGFGIIALAYVIVAYFVLPKLFRIWSRSHPVKHPPIQISTYDGYDRFPLNIGLVANYDDLLDSLEAAGWTLADSGSLLNWLKSISFRIIKKDYPSAPISKLYIFGRSQDVGFEIRSAGRGVRHNLRLWATDFNPAGPLGQQISNPSKIRASFANEQVFWIGSMSRDVLSDLAKNGFDLKHALKINADHERDMLVQTLSHSKQLKKVDLIRLHESFNPKDRAWNVHTRTDGVMAVCHLSPGKSKVELQSKDK